VWFVVLALTRIVSISSMIASLSLTGWNVLFGSHTAYTIAGLVLAVLIVVMHRANIQRLLKGTELKAVGPAEGKSGELTTESTESTE
jgi:glycerol-3-phosphate acyltransferase PlsY